MKERRVRGKREGRVGGWQGGRVEGGRKIGTLGVGRVRGNKVENKSGRKE